MLYKDAGRGDRLEIWYNGGFGRNYLQDVSACRIEQQRDGTKLLRLSLNRKGMYDGLPQGVFHSMDRFAGKGKASGKTFKKEHELQIKEVQHARKLFQPIENEFFRHSLGMEVFFSDHLRRRYSIIYEILFGSPSVKGEEAPVSRAIATFLPRLGSIRGNMHKIALFLSVVLRTRVRVRQVGQIVNDTATHSDSSNTLGSFYLGGNACCGESFDSFDVVWEFSIQADDSLLELMMEGKYVSGLFDFVRSSLIPAGVRARFDIRPGSFRPLRLQDKVGVNKPQYLGVNVTI